MSPLQSLASPPCGGVAASTMEAVDTAPQPLFATSSPHPVSYAFFSGDFITFSWKCYERFIESS
jgi:hypothetical protein